MTNILLWVIFKQSATQQAVQHLGHWYPFWSKVIIIASLEILIKLLPWQQKLYLFHAWNDKILISKLTFVIQWSLDFGRKATTFWFSCVLFTNFHNLPLEYLFEFKFKYQYLPIFTITKWITCWSTDTMYFPNPWNWHNTIVSFHTDWGLPLHLTCGFVSRSSTCLPGSAKLGWASQLGILTRKEGAAKNPYSTSISIPLKQKNPPKRMQKQT